MKWIQFLLLPLLFTACARPVVEQEICREPKRIKRHEKIIIDAGHGGKDAGSANERLKYEEKSMALKTARYLRIYLEELGYDTVMTRSDDTFIPLKTRAEIANNERGALFVSLHYNHAPDQRAEGIEVFYFKEEKGSRTPASKKLGEEVLGHLTRLTGASPRGVKTANFVVIRETKMPAILVEGGFLSNPQEREKLRDPHYLRSVAWGVAKGIDHYLEKSR